MILSYDIQLTADGAVRTDTLRDELRASALVAEPAAVVGVTVDMDPNYRDPGAEIEIEFTRALTSEEASAVLDDLAFHTGS